MLTEKKDGEFREPLLALVTVPLHDDAECLLAAALRFHVLAHAPIALCDIHERAVAIHLRVVAHEHVHDAV